MASNTMGTPDYQDANLRREPARRQAPLRGQSEMPANAANGSEMVQTTEVVAPRDRVRWGPVWAGVLIALTSFMVLVFLGIGLGLISTANGNAGATSGISTGIAGLIAFFLGGWVAESTSIARGSSAGLVNGLLVWALGVTLILVLSVFGLSQLFGAIGNIAGQFLASGHSVTTPAVGSVSSTSVGNVTQTAGWGAFIGMIISAIAAALGGWVSSHGQPLGRVR